MYSALYVVHGRPPQTDTQDTKAERKIPQRKKLYQKQSEERQRELKGEDEELSSARD